jgi:signal recognition particle receptor subunit beta
VAQVNPLTREVLIKLVYYGPGLGGKTTSLQKVHAASPPETRGKIVSLATPVDRTLYFDFMPLRVGPVHGYPVRLQLFTVPGQVYFNATRKLVLTNADGVVFVADSQRERQDANLESLQNLAANLAEQERSLSGMPHVLQYNKRDLSHVLPVAELDHALNQHRVPSFESCAASGLGVLEPLDELVRLVLVDLEKRAVFGDAGAVDPTPRFEASHDGLRESVSRASEEWTEARLEQARGARRSLAPVHRSIPPRLSVAPRPSPRESVPEARVSAREPSGEHLAVPIVEARSLPPEPVHEPVPEPASAPPLARRQSIEPPRTPQFEAEPEPLARAGISFALLFAPELRVQVAELERELGEGDFRSAILRCDSLCSELLADAAEQQALDAEDRRPLLVALGLGMSAQRWHEWRRLVQAARLGGELSELTALEAYTILIELHRLQRRSVAREL